MHRYGLDISRRLITCVFCLRQANQQQCDRTDGHVTVNVGVLPSRRAANYWHNFESDDKLCETLGSLVNCDLIC